MLPVILSGGSGTRLWPLSTPEKPKQFLSLVQEGTTMIQATAERLKGLDFLSKPLVICNKKHLDLVLSQLKKVRIQKPPVILEPVARNTAPAIAAAAFYALEHEKDGLMLVLASDHAVQKKAAFHAAVKKARKIALKNKYALFGIVPTRPETGYGYIETKKASKSGEWEVLSFREKPDEMTAKKYLKAGNYFWNSGMFVLPAGLFLDELKEFEPEMFRLSEAAYKKARRKEGIIALQKSSFEKIRGNSIDYAVMERTKNARAVPLDALWSDVGSWNTVWELSKKDGAKNAGNARLYAADAEGNLVRTTEDGRPVALLGINGCVIIESPQGLLIADRRYMQKVRDAAAALS